jgi:anti-sigma factor RsiW
VTRECQEIRELLDSYLSNELLVETNHTVLRHLATCPGCSAEAERRRTTRDLLMQSLRADVDVAPMRQRIDRAIDAERMWWRRTAQWWSAAAVLAAIAVFIWYPRRVDAAAYADSVGDHIECGLATPADAWYDPARAAKFLRPPFASLAEAVGKSHGAYELVEAHSCPYNGRQYAHLVFRGDGRTISLFAEESTRGALPAASVVAPPDHGLAELFATDRDGYHVDATRTRDHQLFVVSDRTGADQDALARKLLEPAVAFIRSLEN